MKRHWSLGKSHSIKVLVGTSVVPEKTLAFGKVGAGRICLRRRTLRGLRKKSWFGCVDRMPGHLADGLYTICACLPVAVDFAGSSDGAIP